MLLWSNALLGLLRLNSNGLRRLKSAERRQNVAILLLADRVGGDPGLELLLEGQLFGEAAALDEALERALQEESGHGEVHRLPTLPIPVPNFLDFETYLLEVEARSDDLLEKMRVTADSELRLSKMIAGLGWLDAVRLFMMLLFLAQRMEIDLDQDDEETDVTIKVRAKNL